MRNIILLIALLIIALLVTRQFSAPLETTQAGDNQPPSVPTQPQGLEQFSQDMDSFMQDSADRQKQEIDQRTQ